MLYGLAVVVVYVALTHWAAGRDPVIAYNTVWSPLLRRLIAKRMVAITLWHRVFLLRPPPFRLSVSGKKHELIHVGQFRRWPATFPFRYAWASLVAWRQGKDAYRDNRYEVAARQGEWA